MSKRDFEMAKHTEANLDALFPDKDRFREPCAEFVKFRTLLDDAGIEWWDATDSCDYFTMHRTHGDWFSVIYGNHSYGAKFGLLEAMVKGMKDVEGWLTAEEAFSLVKDRRSIYGS